MKCRTLCGQTFRTKLSVCAVITIAFVAGFLNVGKTLVLSNVPTISNEELAEAFMKSIINGDYARVQRFLEQGVDPNTRDLRYRTALYVAQSAGHDNIVTLLRARGASDQAYDQSGLEKRIGSNVNSSMRSYLETLDRQMLMQQAKLEAK